MKFDKKEAALWAGGVLASAAVAFLIYHLQQNNAANAAAESEAAAEEQQSELANQQSYISSLPQTSVPSISASAPVTSDVNTAVNNGGSTPTEDPDLAAIIAAFQTTQPSSVTNASTPVGAIAPLPYPTPPSIPDVVVPTLNDFGSTNNSGVKDNHITTNGAS